MDRYTVVTNQVHVVGRGWYGQKIAYTYDLRAYDMENIGEINRESIQNWLDKNAGDFQSVIEFCIDIGDHFEDFATEEGQRLWNDCHAEE